MAKSRSKAAKAMRELRARRKAAGQCITCGSKAAKGKSRCSVCLYNAASDADFRREQRERAERQFELKNIEQRETIAALLKHIRLLDADIVELENQLEAKYGFTPALPPPAPDTPRAFTPRHVA